MDSHTIKNERNAMTRERERDALWTLEQTKNKIFHTNSCSPITISKPRSEVLNVTVEQLARSNDPVLGSTWKNNSYASI